MMKQTALKVFDKLARRAVRQCQPLLQRRWPDSSYNLLDAAFLRAAFESAEYYQTHMRTAAAFGTDLDLLTRALSWADRNGAVLEFGVSEGRSLRHIAQHWDGPVHAFDSFEGLPEDWRTNYPKGTFSGPPPSDLPVNVSLHVGWFSETLGPFAAALSDAVSLLHVDCDLYSSTACVFSHMAAHIKAGCILVFDEYFNYPRWQDDEYRAFKEFIAQSGLGYQYLGFVPSHQQVCVQIQSKR